LKKSSIDNYHTGVITTDVLIPPQRKNSPISRPETGCGFARNTGLDFLPKLSFQNFETNLPKHKISSKLVLDGKKLERRRRPMTHPYLISEDLSKHQSIPVQLRSHNLEVEKAQKTTEKKLIWRPKSGRVNIRTIETPSEIRHLRMIPTPVVRKTLGQITDEGIMNRQESSNIIKRIKQSSTRSIPMKQSIPNRERKQPKVSQEINDGRLSGTRSIISRNEKGDFSTVEIWLDSQLKKP